MSLSPDCTAIWNADLLNKPLKILFKNIIQNFIELVDLKFYKMKEFQFYQNYELEML